MCSAPVTLGGGTAMTYGCLGLDGSPRDTPDSRQASTQRASTSWGSSRAGQAPASPSVAMPTPQPLQAVRDRWPR